MRCPVPRSDARHRPPQPGRSAHRLVATTTPASRPAERPQARSQLVGPASGPASTTPPLLALRAAAGQTLSPVPKASPSILAQKVGASCQAETGQLCPSILGGASHPPLATTYLARQKH